MMFRLLALSLVIMAGCRDDTPRADAHVGGSARAPSVANGTGTRAPDANARDTAAFDGTLGRTNHDAGDAPVATLTEVRTAARAGGFDRLVFEFDGRVPGYTIEYSARPAECGSGRPAEVSGNAFLVIDLRPAQAHEARGEQQISSIAERDLRLGYDAVRHLLLICDFEATVAWAAGIDKRRPYRAFVLDNPPRLVVDVRTEF
jgi:hypothetical protein